MKRQTVIETLVFLALVITGAGLRIGLRDLPNFAPVAALALFSGYFFRFRSVAIAAPLFVMAASDAFIGAYDWRMMALVYGCLVLPVFFRGPLRRYLSVEDRRVSTWKATAGLVTCSLTMSLLFFLTTNFGSWLCFDSYPQSLVGLIQCYVAALPFFRYTLGGDLVFACLLFGAYGLVMNVVTARHDAPQVVSSTSD